MQMPPYVTQVSPYSPASSIPAHRLWFNALALAYLLTHQLYLAQGLSPHQAKTNYFRVLK